MRGSLVGYLCLIISSKVAVSLSASLQHFRDRKIYFKAYAYGCWQALGSCWILEKGLDLTKWASIRAVHNMVACFPQNEKCKCEKECVEDRSQCLFYILFSEGTYHYFCQVLSSHIEQPNYKVGGVYTNS